MKAIEAGNLTKAKEELQKGTVLINDTQKVIKLANKSEFGWLTVQKYLGDDLADNESDAKKIKKAEKNASAKAKMLQDKKKKIQKQVSFAS